MGIVSIILQYHVYFDAVVAHVCYENNQARDGYMISLEWLCASLVFSPTSYSKEMQFHHTLRDQNYRAMKRRKKANNTKMTTGRIEKLESIDFVCNLREEVEVRQPGVKNGSTSKA